MVAAMMETFADIFHPPQGTLDEQLDLEIERVFCDAGGDLGRWIHRRYDGGPCRNCASIVDLLGPGFRDEIARAQQAVYEALAGFVTP